MVSEALLKQIRQGVYELPKGFKSGMRVPGRLYASREILRMLEDGVLTQLANSATLPGVLKYSIAMPDAHVGYGVPIGCVLGIDYESDEGIISPGAIGYDINCLPETTEVLTDYGFTVKIGELIDLLKDELFLTTKDKDTKVSFVYERPSDKFIIKIKTEGERELELSFDHPILTINGWKLAKEIRVGDLIAVNPFEGVKYERPNEKVILSEKDFEGYDQQIIKYLKDRKLIPLKLNDLKIGILARILGYLIGDGCITNFVRIHKNKEREEYITWFYGDKEGLEKLRKDLEKLGVKVSKIYERVKKIKFRSGEKELISIGKEYSIKVTSKAFSLLLVKLGAPVGNKSKTEFIVPEWIKESPKWVKANFLAGLFGSDGLKPIVKNKTILPINLTFVKTKELEFNLIKFLTDIKLLLKEFDVNAEIYKVEENSEKVMYRLVIHSQESIYNFLRQINYRYTKRQKESLIITEYLRRKIININKRYNSRLLAIQLHSSGKSVNEIAVILDQNKRLVERAVYEQVLDTRISQDFISFEEFIKRYVDKNGIIYDVVSEVKIIKSNYDKLYDIGLEKYHNFVANGIIVHNCGVRVIRTNLKLKDIKDKIKDLLREIFKNVPSGVGSTGKIKVSKKELDEVAIEGAYWAVEHGYGCHEDLERIEEKGRIEGADPECVSPRAKERGREQLGTLGSGNHFLEIAVVEKVFDPGVAEIFGLEKDQIVIWIHTGSRGYGHQICDDYLKVFVKYLKQRKVTLPDWELVFAFLKDKEAQDYFKAMKCAANFAWCNRQMITHWIRESFQKILGKSWEELEMYIVYDIAHNIAKLEKHEVDKKMKKVLVHRKGATRAFVGDMEGVPSVYSSVGHPVLLPGDMGRASYILVGRELAKECWFSCAHGAGRVMSRAQAKKRYRADQVVKELEKRGIYVLADSKATISEEVSYAYKDVSLVVEAVELAGIAKKVVKTSPLAVIKG